MSEAPEKIWIESQAEETSEGYGSWDCRNIYDYDLEYIRADTRPAPSASREPLGYDKGLASSQPSPTNDELNALRLKAFRTNSKQDRQEFFDCLSKAFQRGNLVAHDILPLTGGAVTVKPLPRNKSNVPWELDWSFLDKLHKEACSYEDGAATHVAVEAIALAVERHILSAITASEPDNSEQHPDDQAVDRFAVAMKAKLKHAREAKGKSGWDTDRCSDEFLADEMVAHITKGNTGTFEDVANFCMMLHQREASPHTLAATYHKAQSYDPNPLPPSPDTQPEPEQDVREAARVLLSYMPNYAMERAALESRATDDEGKFESLSDLLDFSGQNKSYTVVREALSAALRSLAQEGE